MEYRSTWMLSKRTVSHVSSQRNLVDSEWMTPQTQLCFVGRRLQCFDFPQTGLVWRWQSHRVLDLRFWLSRMECIFLRFVTATASLAITYATASNRCSTPVICTSPLQMRLCHSKHLQLASPCSLWWASVDRDELVPHGKFLHTVKRALLKI